MKLTSDAGSGIISFSTTPDVERALERAAAVDLVSRAAFVRKLVVSHLRSAGFLSGEARVVGRAGRPRRNV